MSDFEYEFEMALMNKHLYPEVETVFMMASQKYLYVSSSRLKELVRMGVITSYSIHYTKLYEGGPTELRETATASRARARARCSP